MSFIKDFNRANHSASVRSGVTYSEGLSAFETLYIQNRSLSYMAHFSDAPPEKYRALVTHFPNGVLVLFDSELRYEIVGPETLPFSKRDASKMVGKTIYDLFPEETATQLEPKLRATPTGELCSFDMEYEEQVHHIETRPVRIQGDTYGALVTQEVTEERQTARELEQQNQRLDKFARIVSHDLLNPLNVAQGRLELAQEECDTEHHNAIATALDRIQRIVEDVLWLAREGQDIGSVEPVALGKAIESAWRMVSGQADNAELRYAGDESQLPTVKADYDRLCQLLENLFKNAVEHGGDDVTITVGALADGFSIGDDGPGIPDEEREDVFDPGYSTVEDGTGLGLSIVKQVVEAHDWEIQVTESSAGGARFEFTGLDVVAK